MSFQVIYLTSSAIIYMTLVYTTSLSSKIVSTPQMISSLPWITAK